MQIVIDISNWLYNAIMEYEEPHYSKSLGDAVRDGTPLPKGHSNLIDTKDLYKYLNKERDDNFVLRVDAIVNRVKPIIEADKENENESYRSTGSNRDYFSRGL